MKFIVWAPSWTLYSSGIRACHSLAHELQRRGHQVQIANAKTYNPEWPDVKLMEFANEPLGCEAVTIYPEIRDDNPLAMMNVVYWRLSEIHHSFSYPSLKYKWAPGFNVDADGILHVPHINREVCNTKEKLPRGWTISYKAPGGDIVISDSQPIPWYELMDMFKRATLFICGDPKTALMEEARLCGCPVMMTCAPRPNIYEYDTSIGLSWGGGKLKHAQDTVMDFGREWDAYIELGHGLVDEFIEKCKVTYGA
jgi:hypothetical protein